MNITKKYFLNLCTFAGTTVFSVQYVLFWGEILRTLARRDIFTHDI